MVDSIGLLKKKMITVIIANLSNGKKISKKKSNIQVLSKRIEPDLDDEYNQMKIV